jgi:type II secretory pathway pseudopilin PulG
MPVACCKYPRGGQQRGFALLLVFLMAGILAITLYMELPRVAMESQRDKEQTLIDRGEQYKRAIQLFVDKTKRYPSDIKELENFQNQRFLRHRYIDPMTGKDEWRLIHINHGMLTDSKLTKPNGPGGKEETKTPNGFVGELAGIGSSQNPTQGGGAVQADTRERLAGGRVLHRSRPPQEP